MSSVQNKLKKLREGFIDKYPELAGIKDELLILSLTKSDSNLPETLTNYQKINFGSSDYERLEFLGDAILETVISEMIFDNFNLVSEGELSEFRSKIVRNSSLSCLSKNKKLCNLIIPKKFSNSKNCADVFEALIGAIYYYLKTSHHPNPLRFVVKWLNTEWDFISIMNYLLTHPEEIDVCKFIYPQQTPPSSPSNDDQEKEGEEKEKEAEKEMFDQVYQEEEIKLKEIREHVNYLIEEERRKLENMSMDNLLIQQAAVVKEVAKRTEMRYKTRLDNYYNKYNLQKPVNYIYIQKGRYGKKNIVGIACPLNIKCDTGKRYMGYNLIGIGESYAKKDAEELAAEQAFNYLTKK